MKLCWLIACGLIAIVLLTSQVARTDEIIIFNADSAPAAAADEEADDEEEEATEDEVDDEDEDEDDADDDDDGSDEDDEGDDEDEDDDGDDDDEAAQAKPAVYDEEADATDQIKAASSLAKHTGRRVLLVFGGNWCGWCIKLHNLFEENEEIGLLLNDEFVPVWIDTKQLDKHQELADEYRDEMAKHGVPFLAVLDVDGKVLVKQNTSDLEDGPKHDPEKVREFLKTWTAPRVDAEQALADALDRAGQSEKLVLVHVGNPGCGWCHKLEEFLAAHPEPFARDYEVVKVDTARMDNGSKVAEKLGYGNGDGVPWMAIVNPQGEVLITSHGPNGNIGYPAMPEEIEYFDVMLTKTAKHNTPEQLAEIKDLLEKEGAEIRAKLRR